MTQTLKADQISRLLGIVRAFVNPVEIMHGIPVRLDMGCLRQDAEKLLKEIDGEQQKPVEHVLVAHSLSDIDDLITWLDEHPSDDELRRQAIDPSKRWDAMGLLNGVAARHEASFPARLRLPDNKDVVTIIELVIEDYAEVMSAHRDEFHTRIEEENVQDAN